MPTGYTAKLCNEEQTFGEFVLTCARAMGALVTMRDEPLDAPIPDEFRPDTRWHEDSRTAAEAERDELMAMSDDEVAEALRALRESVERKRQDVEERTAAVRARLEAMIARVGAWTPPTPDHEGLKKFMLEQLSETKRVDGTFANWPSGTPSDVQAWKSAKMRSLEADIAYHTQRIAEEIERTKERNEWVRGLRESLAMEEARS